MKVLISALIVATWVLFFIWFVEGAGKGKARIKFNDFIKYYNQDSNKWELWSESVYLEDKCRFYFGPIDYYRYIYWQRTLKKNKAKQMLEEIFGDKED
jgi:hypothetical protein